MWLTSKRWRDWKSELANDELSENGLMADKTMNTTLHLMEAYTELYLADHSPKVLERLKFQLELTYDKIFDKQGNKLLVFFDKNTSSAISTPTITISRRHGSSTAPPRSSATRSLPQSSLR